MRWWITLVLCMQSVVACEGAPAPQDPEPEPQAMTAEGPTWYGEIRDIVDVRCNGCHVEGGAAPMPLTEVADVQALADILLESIEDLRMPPWPPSADCRHYANERIMPEAEKEAFRRWVDAGVPLGDPSEAGPRHEAPRFDDFPATAVGKPLEPYVPNDTWTDDYRCLPLDLTFEEDVYLTGSRVAPGSDALVHHVLIYAIAPEQADDLELIDMAEEGAGYTCFGGSEVGTPNPIGAWVPGIPPLEMVGGEAIHIEAGSRIVMQVHYNMLGGPAEPDLTEWHARFQAAEPGRLLVSRPYAHRTMVIPAGQSDVSVSKEFVNKSGEDWEIVALGPHMHLLGTRILVEKVDAEGAEECMLDIPRWDFNWQQNYDLREDEHVIVAPGESIRLTCEYDNSQANQPWVDGHQVTTGEVVWGDRTLDEMCLTFLTFARPFEAPAARCEVFNDCTVACTEDSDFRCLTRCMSQDVSCAMCLIPQIFTTGTCLDTACTEEMEAADTCLLGCAGEILGTGGDFDTCMQANCPEATEALDACTSPVIDDGHCDASMLSCNAQI